MHISFKRLIQCKLLLLFIALLNMTNQLAAQEKQDLEYIQMEPIIVTNYLKKSSKKPGYVQIKAQLTVKGEAAATKINIHLPLVRDFIIESLSFTDEKIIKDVTKRKQLRATLTAGIKALLTKEVGEPLIEELIITHFMWE